MLDISNSSSMPLVVSSVGYYTATLTSFSTEKPLLIYLTPRVFEVKEVVISSHSLVKRKEANMDIFKNMFLGMTVNARNCEILNEKDITFNYDSDRNTLKAFASKPILIINKRLGYRITYYLERFEYYKKEMSMAFKGSMIFTEDLATEETYKQLFESRRRDTYLGSRMHFFRALWADDLISTGFIVRNSDGKSLKYNDIVDDSRVDSVNNRFKFLSYTEKLTIQYNLRSTNIIFIKEYVSFDKNGNFDQTGMSISWEGEMMKKRLGDMLPYTFELKE